MKHRICYAMEFDPICINRTTVELKLFFNYVDVESFLSINRTTVELKLYYHSPKSAFLAVLIVLQ